MFWRLFATYLLLVLTAVGLVGVLIFRRHDTLLAQLMQRIPELEPPSQEPRESPLQPQEGEPPPTRGEPRPGLEPQASRPWWRKIFGG